MPKIEKTAARAEANERNEGKGATRALQILELAVARNVTPADMFISLAAMVQRQNPNLGEKLLDALEFTVRLRPMHPPADAVVIGGPHANATLAPAVAGNVSAPVAETSTRLVGDECQCGACQAEEPVEHPTPAEPAPFRVPDGVRFEGAPLAEPERCVWIIEHDAANECLVPKAVAPAEVEGGVFFQTREAAVAECERLNGFTA